MNPWVRLARFNAVGAIGIGVQLATLWFLTAVAHVHYFIATPLAVTLAVVHNFVWHCAWTWSDRATSSGVGAAFVRFAAINGLLSLVGTVLVTGALVLGAHTSPVVANVVAIGICGLLNFWLGETLVFPLLRQ